MSSIRVHHPVEKSNQPARISTKILIAQGCGTAGSDEVFGVLYRDADGGRPVATGERVSVRSSTLWALRFKNYPSDVSLLVLYRSNSGDEIARIRLSATPGLRDISPLYPTNNETVPTSFFAYGETDENTTEPVASINTSPQADGTLEFGPPSNPGYYGFDFTDVPTATNRTLSIVADTTSNTTITIAN